MPIVFAFSAGLVAAFNPCGAAMFPAYIGYQFNSGYGRIGHGGLFVRGVALGLSVTAGFIVVFGMMGVILFLGGRFAAKLLPAAGLIVGLITVVVGLWLIVARKKLTIQAPGRLYHQDNKGYYGTFLFGIGYAVASLSCALPVFLAAIGILAGTTPSIDGTASILVGSVSYGLGMGLIMTGVTLSVLFFEDFAYGLVNAVSMYMDTIGKIIMIGAGLYIIWYWTMGVGGGMLFGSL